MRHANLLEYASTHEIAIAGSHAVGTLARPPRLDVPGALYHVTARGNAREPIYRDDHDREHFLALLGATCERYGWACHAYCLMTNHYHLLLALEEAPAGRLVRGMQHLDSRSAQQFNRTGSAPKRSSHRSAQAIKDGRPTSTSWLVARGAGEPSHWTRPSH